MGKSFVKGLKQLLVIVFSVVLGILLSEQIEDRKNEKEAELLQSKITSEVTENKVLLEKWVPYHRKVYHSLDSFINDDAFINEFIKDQTILYEKVFTEGNLMGRTPSNDAWDIAKSHPLVVHFNYEDLLILSKIYNQQGMTYNSIPKMIDMLLSPEFNNEIKAKSNLMSFKNQLREVVSREIQLLNYIYEAEKTMGFESE